jgi:hypothetical protein
MSDVIEDVSTLRNFKRLRDDIDTAPFLEEIARSKIGWTDDLSRARIPAQRETQTIGLRGRVPEPGTPMQDTHGTAWHPRAENYPRLCEFLRAFAAERRGELSRAMLVRLPPGGRVYRHIDLGEYFRIRDRHHLVLDSLDGSLLSCGDELVRLRNRELWWFDNKKPHHSINDGRSWRVHLIFDLLPFDGEQPGVSGGARDGVSQAEATDIPAAMHD